jgi:16S rRNA G966 N2-methylase RsmD
VNPDVREQLDDLRSTVEDARSRPMSHSVVVNRDELLETLDRLERAIEAATAESERVVAQREEVLAEGEAIAIELVRQAELRRDALVEREWVSPGGLVVLERSRRGPAAVWRSAVTPAEEKKYGETMLRYGHAFPPVTSPEE